MTPERKQHLLALAAAWLLALPFAISTTVLPWGRDQGIYAHAATRLLDGYVPYAETYVFKPPATIFVHAASMLLFGRNMLAIRVFDVFWTLATVAVLYGIAVRATQSRFFAALTGVVFAAIYHHYTYWNTAQTDGWTNLPIGLALLLALGDEANPRRALAAGVLAGIAFWFKYTVGLVFPIAVLLPLLRRGRGGLPEAGAVIAGFALAVGGGVLAMMALGAWDDFVEIQTEVVFPYSGATKAAGGDEGIARKSFDRFVKGVGTLGGPVSMVISSLGLLAVLGDLAWRRKLDDRAVARLAALGWAVTGLASAWTQGKFFSYQYLATVGAAALLVPIALSTVAEIVPRGRYVVIPACVILLGWTGSQKPFPNRWQILWNLAQGKTTLEHEYDKGNYGFKDMSLDHNMAMGKWLKENTPEGEPVFIWAYDPMIYVLAGRDMTSRFPYTFPLVVSWAPVEKYEQELISALRDDPPSAFVIGKDDGVFVVMGHRRDSRKTLVEFEEMNAWLRENYVQQKDVGRFQVWTRRR
jgi:4-amino-4-deoxy-L-arabinose transferase-like glycosyltransferase